MSAGPALFRLKSLTIENTFGYNTVGFGNVLRKVRIMSKNEFTCDCTVVHESAVREAKQKMQPDEIYGKAADFFKLLGDMTRVKIIGALDCHELCVCDIANILGMTKSAVSHQLSLLRREGFVVCRRDGKAVYYSLADSHIREILESGIVHIQE